MCASSTGGPVVVDDLIDRVTELEQLPAMGLGTHADLGQGQRIAAGRPGDADAFRALVGFLCFEGARQLVDEQRNAVRELLFRGRPFWPLRDLQLAPLDQFVTVVGQERMHGGTPF